MAYSRSRVTISSYNADMELTLLPLWLTVLYLLIHLLLTVYSRHPRPDRSRVIAVDLLLSTAVASLLAAGGHNPAAASVWLRIPLLWLPLIFFWWAYLWAGKTLTALFPRDFNLDGFILRLEERFFRQPSLHWARKGNRLLTELLHFCYFSYYLYTPTLAIYLYTAGRFRDFESMSFAVLFGYAVSYTLFAMVPVWGPRWALVDAGLLEASERRLEGFWLTRFINWIMYDGVAHKGGAMPSSHSSTAVVFMVWCWKLWGPAGGIPASAIVAGMWAGSVYGRYHYLIDVIVGAALGAAGLLLASLLI